MKTKPMWGLWLLMIVAPVAMFVGVNYWKNLPPRFVEVPPPITLPTKMSLEQAKAQQLPYFSDFIIENSTVGAKYLNLKMTHYFPVHAVDSRFKVVVITGKPEIKDLRNLRYNVVYSGNSLVRRLYTQRVVRIKQNRKKNVVFHILWNMGGKHGTKSVTIMPQMTPQN